MSVGQTTSFVVAETIETNGDSHLKRSVSGDYQVVTGADTLVLLDESGVTLNLIEFPAHQFQQAEILDDGSMGLIVRDGNESVHELWRFDTNGLLTERAAISYLADWEVQFDADMNGDGTLGLQLEEIESNGDAHLHRSSDGRYYVEVNNALTELSFDDAEAGLESALAQLSLTQVAGETDGSYLALWQGANIQGVNLQGAASQQGASAQSQANEFVISKHGTDGVLIDTEVVTSIQSAESIFEADLDGDGVVGNSTPINSTSTNESDEGFGGSALLPILGVLAFAALNELGNFDEISL